MTRIGNFEYGMAVEAEAVRGGPAVTRIERRETRRFPVREKLKYRLLTGSVDIAGMGETLNIGSGGVLFTTEHCLPINKTVELTIDWPVRLDGTCALSFVATGRVVRSENGRAAVRIDRYVFRTRASRARDYLKPLTYAAARNQ